MKIQENVSKGIKLVNVRVKRHSRWLLSALAFMLTVALMCAGANLMAIEKSYGEEYGQPIVPCVDLPGTTPKGRRIKLPKPPRNAVELFQNIHYALENSLLVSSDFYSTKNLLAFFNAREVIPRFPEGAIINGSTESWESNILDSSLLGQSLKINVRFYCSRRRFDGEITAFQAGMTMSFRPEQQVNFKVIKKIFGTKAAYGIYSGHLRGGDYVERSLGRVFYSIEGNPKADMKSLGSLEVIVLRPCGTSIERNVPFPDDCRVVNISFGAGGRIK